MYRMEQILENIVDFPSNLLKKFITDVPSDNETCRPVQALNFIESLRTTNNK